MNNSLDLNDRYLSEVPTPGTRKFERALDDVLLNTSSPTDSAFSPDKVGSPYKAPQLPRAQLLPQIYSSFKSKSFILPSTNPSRRNDSKVVPIDAFGLEVILENVKEVPDLPEFMPTRQKS